MNLIQYREYCIQKIHVTESFPFDEQILVFKVANKMFTLTNIRDFSRINVKCNPEKAIELRNQYEGVIPAWHMNKKHWNSLLLNQDLQDKDIYQWIDHSYDLVVTRLPKKIQAQICKESAILKKSA